MLRTYDEGFGKNIVYLRWKKLTQEKVLESKLFRIYLEHKTSSQCGLCAMESTQTELKKALDFKSSMKFKDQLRLLKYYSKPLTLSNPWIPLHIRIKNYMLYENWEFSVDGGSFDKSQGPHT